jgi:hypothetical protein
VDVQHVTNGAARSDCGWWLDRRCTADTDERLGLAVAAGERANSFSAGVQLDHVSQRTGRETGCGRFQQHAGEHLAASQYVLWAVVVGG